MLMKMKFKSGQKGISLLEVMLSLAIIAIILVMATRYFGIASGTSKLNQATGQINEIKQGLAQWSVNNGSYSGATLTTLSTANFITSETAAGQNPWGGTLGLSATATSATITMEGLPTGVCDNLKSRLGTGASCPAPTSFSYAVQ